MRNNYRSLRYLSAIVILTAVLVTGFVLNKPNISAAISNETAVSNLGNLPVYFEENQGQFDEKVRYYTRGTNDYSLFLTATDAVYVLHEARRGAAIDEINDRKSKIENQKSTAVYMTLAGANPNADFAGTEMLEHKTNYFKGAESDWRTNISNFGRVRANGIYVGIDMVWFGKRQGGVQYDFVIAPNANPDQIEWEIKGATDVVLTAEGELLIKTEFGEIRQQKPFSYQDENGIRQEIESRFVIEQPKIKNQKSKIRFEIGDYDRSKPLTIDPSVNLSRIAFSTLMGGPINDQGNALAVDNSGNVFVTGKAPSPTFPTTPGTFDTTHNGADDIFVTKLNSTGTALIYSTFIGGSDEDIAAGIAIDSAGNAFLTGLTVDGTSDFPITAGTFDTTPNGGQDVFVTKLNATGSALIYSTLIGGSGDEVGWDIAIDLSGNAFLMGGTLSANYPTTGGAFDTTYNGSGDVFATKLNASGSALIYSTFIGSSDFDNGFGIAVDSAGNAYLTGHTYIAVTPFPTTPGALDTTHNGFDDVFVTKLNPAGSALTYSTFIGGLESDRGFSIAVDSEGNAFLTGHTQDSTTTDFPVTAGAFDSTHNGGEDVFATKLNAAGSALIYSTFLGGSGNEQGHGIVTDSAGNAHLMGFTDDAATDYPTTAGAFNTTHNGSIDVFVTKLNPAGSTLIYSSFLGGSGVDRGTSIVLDSAGNAFLAGLTLDDTTDYPTSPGGYDTTHNGNADPFVTKLSGASRSFDFDGDGKTDIAIFRPSNGQWWQLHSSDGGNAAFQFGTASDKLVPTDFTGDGKTDIAVWRPSTGEWFILRSEDFSFFAFPFGTDGDFPAPADYDGDGKADAAVFRPSSAVWYINRSSGGFDIIGFGASGDKPVVADYDGDGKADLAIYRNNGGNSEWWLRKSSDLSGFAAQFGVSTDKAVQGDYTGDGKADIAFWRPSSGDWFILRSEDYSYFSFTFGAATDVPVPGDYDGDGRFDAGVFRPSNSAWFIERSASGTLIQGFGTMGDVPVPNAFVP